MHRLSIAFVLVSACATTRTPCPSAEPIGASHASRGTDGVGWIEHTFAALRSADPPIELQATVLARGDLTDDGEEDAIVAIDQGRTRRTLLVWSGGAQLIGSEHDVLAAIIGHLGARLRTGTASGEECEHDVYEEQWTWSGTELTRASVAPRLLRPGGCEGSDSE